MPDPFEVHSGSRWEWGTQGRGGRNTAAIADQTADPAPAKPAPDPKYKDLTRCKHAPDKRHHPVLVLRPVVRSSPECKWGIVWYRRSAKDSVQWRCNHQRECEFCHKVYQWQLSTDECPDYPGCEKQKAAVLAYHEKRLAEIAARQDPWAERLRAKKEAKSRRTAYRKPKAGKK